MATLVMAVLPAGCGGSAPPLAADLPADWRSATVVVNARTRIRYPLGSRTAALRSDLERQGLTFTPDPWGFGASHAEYVLGGVACSAVVHVWWRSDGRHRVTARRGSYQEACM